MKFLRFLKHALFQASFTVKEWCTLVMESSWMEKLKTARNMYLKALLKELGHFIFLECLFVLLLGAPWNPFIRELWRIAFSNSPFPFHVMAEQFFHPIGFIYTSFHHPLVQPLQCILFLYWMYRAWKTAIKNWGLLPKMTPEEGDAQWETKKEILASDSFSFEEAGVSLGKIGRNTLHQLYKGALNGIIAVFGNTGSGKTIGFLVANLLKEMRSFVTTDVKGEAYGLTANAKRHSHDVYVINFGDPENSARFNPMDYIESDIDAQKVAHFLAQQATPTGNEEKDKYFRIMGESLLTSLILYVKYECPPEQHHLGSVFNLLTQFGGNFKQLASLIDGLEPDHPVSSAFSIVRMADNEKTRADILSTAASMVDLLKFESFQHMLGGSDFHFNDIGTKPTAVYVILEEADNTFDALIGLFFTQLYDQLTRFAKQQPTRKLPHGVVFALDEVNNFSPIPSLDKRMNTARGYDMLTWVIMQSLSKLEERYGERGAHAIISAADTIIFMGTGDDKTGHFIVDRIGKTTFEYKNISTTDSGATTVTTQRTRKSLLSFHQVMRMRKYKKNKLVILTQTHDPILAKKISFYNLFPQGLTRTTHLSSYRPPKRDDYEAFQKSDVFPAHAISDIGIHNQTDNIVSLDSFRK